MDMECVKTELAPIFSGYREEIVAAYLFGSMARGVTNPSSDIDIAVLTRNRDKKSGAALKLRLYADLCRSLKRNDVDLVLLDLSGNLILNDKSSGTGRLFTRQTMMQERNMS